MKTAVTIPTGRPNVRNVVKSFLKNAETYGHDLKDFSVYLSIDTKYKDTRVDDLEFWQIEKVSYDET